MTRGTALRLLLSATSGVALALSFPKAGLSAFAWVALVPLLYAAEGEPLGAVFGYGWLQGFACYLLSLYWVVITLHRFAGVRPLLAVGPLLALAGVLALYTGLSIWIAEFVTRRLRVPIVVTLPVAWTAMEWVRSFFPIGFPWDLMGYSAYRDLSLIQFAEFTGVYGVSALIALFNSVIYVVVFGGHARRVQRLSLAVLTVLMVAASAFSVARIRQLERDPAVGRLRVAMVQGDIPQTIKWNPLFLQRSFTAYVHGSEAAAKRGADLIVWPEAAATFYFQPTDRYPAMLSTDERYRARLLKLARDVGEPILFGAPALGVEDGRVGSYNRAYLVSGGGTVVDYYDKIQLVPFGEYVPLRSVLGYFVNRIVAGFGDMFPGRRQTIFTVKGARLGVLICYESIFPDLSRRAVKRGAEILLNITNDAWYGRSSAPYQLLAMAAMRSVETKVPMVRVANTGVSAVILPTGEITARTPLFVRTTQIETVGWRPERTVYTQVGDLFSEVLAALTLVAFGLAALRPAREAPPSAELPGSENGRCYRTGAAFSRKHGH